MKTILSNTSKSFEINKSKFIVFLFFVKHKNDVQNILKKHKQNFKDATHNCYAYILDNNTYYSSDDGEPTSTAGKPILNSLQNNNMNYTLAIVTRYYGGIMLGAGGLVRAYSGSTSKTIQNSKTIDLIIGKEVEIIFTHQQLKEIDFLLKNEVILKKEFDFFITYNIGTNNSEIINTLKRKVSNIKILNEKFIIKNVN